MARNAKPNIRRRRIFAIAAICTVIGSAAVAWFVLRKPGDETNPRASFAPPAKALPSSAEPALRQWPMYGLDPARTKWFKASGRLDPPYTRLWTYRGKKLLEFPPVVAGHALYILDDGGALRRLDSLTGRQKWRRQLGALAAASPAYADRTLYAVTLLSSPGSDHGSAFAINASTGGIIWRHDLPARAESSPVVIGSRVVFGSEDGTVYSLDRATGRTAWTYKADGAVKGGLALSAGRLYFGDYGGSVHAISASNGGRIWSANPGGTFYSTGAVAWGRFYIGNTDGRLYSYTTTGDLAWARQTGAYVYSSPAVANLAGIGPTVFAGSYDGNFYAWDAKTGTSRWTYDAGGKISGGATVIGDLVWFADLGNTRNVALNARTGRKVFSMETGSFNPVITDGQRMYIVGYGDMFAYSPKRALKPSP